MGDTRKRKYEFVCMDSKCMVEGTGGCTLSFYSEVGSSPDEPNYCPYETDPQDHKFVPWRLLK